MPVLAHLYLRLSQHTAELEPVETTLTLTLTLTPENYSALRRV